MPEYTYTDEQGHVTTITHRMLYTTAIICAVCDLEMWKRPPQIAGVLWGGLPPSAGDTIPEFREFVDTADERRDRYEEKLDERRRLERDKGNGIPGQEGL